MKKVTLWSVIGSLWTAAFLFLMIYVAIPDYPYGVPLWESICLDPNGFWHELYYLAVGWGLGMATLAVYSLWYAAVSFLSEIRWVGVLPDGQPVFLRVKKKKGV